MVLKEIEGLLSKSVKIMSYEVKIVYVILFVVFLSLGGMCTLGCTSHLCMKDIKDLLTNSKEFMENRGAEKKLKKLTETF